MPSALGLALRAGHALLGQMSSPGRSTLAVVLRRGEAPFIPAEQQVVETLLAYGGQIAARAREVEQQEDATLSRKSDV